MRLFGNPRWLLDTALGAAACQGLAEPGDGNLLATRVAHMADIAAREKVFADASGRNEVLSSIGKIEWPMPLRARSRQLGNSTILLSSRLYASASASGNGYSIWFCAPIHSASNMWWPAPAASAGPVGLAERDGGETRFPRNLESREENGVLG